MIFFYLIKMTDFLLPGKAIKLTIDLFMEMYFYDLLTSYEISAN